MKKNKYPIIAKEGWLYIIIILFISTYLTLINSSISVLFWIISIFIIQFFRDPKRKISDKKNVIVSGADGRVIAINETFDPYQKKKSIKVSVFMNVFNVHSNKAPIDGIILKKIYFPGKFLNAALSKASLENERCAIIIQSKNNSKRIITCVQIAGLVARRILCYKETGDELTRGERYGFIKFGSRVDLYLPLNTSIKVQLGQKVKNGESIIAEFI
ncbi:MAG: phosphatidylserine decarboxylase [Nitrosomonadales bacterium]|nr:phosphatidylserine decarboxylase [Nitrosomonadales bacterium]MBT3918449.1 phosphatidylserine decarboxylase [Nitrosomonadales bacterium]MBT4183083.1 phosphatidylserine decarboxylase [Nitrosomonadales bacterium]MBT4570778.1 phosphatidylserine decarboxylase [Nitrosomonadales bacterium]MBT6014850.1 phosphatidylserine decarboxylase [Nitrosomonadales bacterium]